ncbi:MAG TPA: hypothetical protein VIR01_07850, partial [Pyrinomonadaceae bacterium]
LALKVLFEEQEDSPQLSGLKSFADFRANGFHYCENPREIQTLFLDKISKLHGYRAHLAFTDRTALPDLDDNQRVLILYRTLITDLILQTRHSEIVFLFEHNSQLNSQFSELVEIGVEEARNRSHGRRLPTASVEIVKKNDLFSLSIIDYCMATVSNWADAGFVVDKQNWQYRNYLSFERNIAMIFDFDRRMRSTRDNRMFH